MKKEEDILRDRVQERWSLLTEGEGQSLGDEPRMQTGHVE